MARKFTLTFSIDNDAFGDQPQWEIARILRSMAERIDDGGLAVGEIYRASDSNGARVGFATVEDEEV